MTIQPCTSHLSWKEWEIAHPDLSFLQSWEWGEFQRSVGHEPVRWQLFDGGKRIGQVQGFFHRIVQGVSYLYLPRMYSEGVEIAALRQAAKDGGIDFLRIEPISSLPKGEKYVFSTVSRQPAQTLIVDISADDQTLFAGMHTKTRYNIRVAQKNSVQVDETKDVNIFWKLNEETTARDAFKSHTKEYYTKFLQLPMVHQFTAYVNDVPIASILCVGFGNTFTYVHGASSNEMRNVMAPYALQWHAMQFGKSHGYTRYDLWGIAPLIPEEGGEDVQCLHGKCWRVAHPWSGITRFKVGFGGAYVVYGEAVEVACNSLVYWLLGVVKKIKKKIRLRKNK